MRVSDETLLAIYKRQGQTEEQAQATLAKVRGTYVDPGITPPCIDYADDDSYFGNCTQERRAHAQIDSDPLA